MQQNSLIEKCRNIGDIFVQIAIVDKYQDSWYFLWGGGEMAYTEAQKRAIIKYIDEKTDDIRMRVAKGTKDRYKAEAEKHGLSTTKFILNAVETYLEMESNQVETSDLRQMISNTDYEELMRILSKKGLNLKDFLSKAITTYIAKHKDD